MEGASPQVICIFDCTSSMQKEYRGASKEDKKAARLLYERLTGKPGPAKVTRHLMLLMFLYRVGKEAADEDFDGVLHVLFMGTDLRTTIQAGDDVNEQLDTIARSTLRSHTTGSALLPDLKEAVDMYLADIQPTVVIVLTDGSFSDRRDLEAYMHETTPQIVRHAPRLDNGAYDDAHFGIIIVLVIEPARVEEKKAGVLFIDGPFSVPNPDVPGGKQDVDICAIRGIHEILPVTFRNLQALARDG